MLLRELVEYDTGASQNSILCRVIGESVGDLDDQPDKGKKLLELTAMEITLKDLVKTRVLGHLEVGARESVLARDASRFCNQISA